MARTCPRCATGNGRHRAWLRGVDPAEPRFCFHGCVRARCRTSRPPRAYGWMDSSVYLSHMERARRLRGAPMPEGYLQDPRFYDGVSSTFIASGQPLPLPPGDVGLDFEGEVAVILNDVPAGIGVNDVAGKVILLCLPNDTTLRTVCAEQARRDYTSFQAKPPCSMAQRVLFNCSQANTGTWCLMRPRRSACWDRCGGGTGIRPFGRHPFHPPGASGHRGAGPQSG